MNPSPPSAPSLYQALANAPELLRRPSIRFPLERFRAKSLPMQSVIDYLKQNEARAVKELCEYVRFPSVSAQAQHRQDLRACAEWVVERCRQIGLEARLCPTPGHPSWWPKRPAANGQEAAARVLSSMAITMSSRPSRSSFGSPRPSSRASKAARFSPAAPATTKARTWPTSTPCEAYLEDRHRIALRPDLRHRGRGGSRQQQPGGFSEGTRAELPCDAVVISDTGMPTPKHPALTYALRGIAAFEVTLHGPSRDLHSGIFGGTVDNPAMALVPNAGQAARQERPRRHPRLL